MRTIKSLDQAVELSLKARDSKEYLADFTIKVDSKTWHVHTVSISHRDILCYCKEGTATFLVDSYGDRTTIELYDWNRE